MILAGVDEVGRGCWAGPLVAAAVVLPEVHGILGLQDSKKLSRAQRERLVTEINAEALAIGVGWVWPIDIDAHGLTNAVQNAMQQAVDALGDTYDELIIDGNINYFPANIKAKAVIKADGSVPAVSAASIIAKVARDEYMYKIALDYPQYGFEKHVGYGTKAHIDALAQFGVTDIHRRSYKPIKALLDL